MLHFIGTWINQQSNNSCAFLPLLQNDIQNCAAAVAVVPAATACNLPLQRCLKPTGTWLLSFHTSMSSGRPGRLDQAVTQHASIPSQLLTSLLPVATIVLEASAKPLAITIFLGKPTATPGELLQDFLVAELPGAADGECSEIAEAQLGALALLAALSFLLGDLPKRWESLLAYKGPMLCLLSLNLQQCANGERLAQPASRTCMLGSTKVDTELTSSAQAVPGLIAQALPPSPSMLRDCCGLLQSEKARRLVLK